MAKDEHGYIHASIWKPNSYFQLEADILMKTHHECFESIFHSHVRAYLVFMISLIAFLLNLLPMCFRRRKIGLIWYNRKMKYDQPIDLGRE